MSSTETTELKLTTTPTGGIDASHSPYYRRLLSAGYKGYLQGTIGGASLYGLLGLAVGSVVAAPLLISGTLGIAAAASIAAAFGGAGVLKGASTFGTIGSTAAINAESADLSEQRRYLLDRYYDLPEGPEGDREAEAIKQELIRERESREKPPSFFHWQTALMGAALGAALALGFVYFFTPAITAHAVTVALEGVMHIGISEAAAAGLANLGTIGLASLVTFGGGLLGSTIGIDRYYIRKWFDHTEGVVHGSHHKTTALIERSEQIARLKSAAMADAQTKKQLGLADVAEQKPEAAFTAPAATAPVKEPAPTTSRPIASLNVVEQDDTVPNTKVAARDAVLHQRLATIQQAMDIPAI
jgi:hypothetical protein